MPKQSDDNNVLANILEEFFGELLIIEDNKYNKESLISIYARYLSCDYENCGKLLENITVGITKKLENEGVEALYNEFISYIKERFGKTFSKLPRQDNDSVKLYMKAIHDIIMNRYKFIRQELEKIDVSALAELEDSNKYNSFVMAILNNSIESLSILGEHYTSLTQEEKDHITEAVVASVMSSLSIFGKKDALLIKGQKADTADAKSEAIDEEDTLGAQSLSAKFDESVIHLTDRLAAQKIDTNNSFAELTSDAELDKVLEEVTAAWVEAFSTEIAGSVITAMGPEKDPDDVSKYDVSIVKSVKLKWPSNELYSPLIIALMGSEVDRVYFTEDGNTGSTIKNMVPQGNINISLIEQLIEIGAYVRKVGGKNNTPPIVFAALSGNFHALFLLWQKGAHLCDADTYSNTAFVYLKNTIDKYYNKGEQLSSQMRSYLKNLNLTSIVLEFLCAVDNYNPDPNVIDSIEKTPFSPKEASIILLERSSKYKRNADQAAEKFSNVKTPQGNNIIDFFLEQYPEHFFDFIKNSEEQGLELHLNFLSILQSIIGQSESNNDSDDIGIDYEVGKKYDKIFFQFLFQLNTNKKLKDFVEQTINEEGYSKNNIFLDLIQQINFNTELVREVEKYVIKPKTDIDGDFKLLLKEAADTGDFYACFLCFEIALSRKWLIDLRIFRSNGNLDGYLVSLVDSYISSRKGESKNKISYSMVTAILRLFISFGFDLNQIGKDGQSVLDHAKEEPALYNFLEEYNNKDHIPKVEREARQYEINEIEKILQKNNGEKKSPKDTSARATSPKPSSKSPKVMVKGLWRGLGFLGNKEETELQKIMQAVRDIADALQAPNCKKTLADLLKEDKSLAQNSPKQTKSKDKSKNKSKSQPKPQVDIIQSLWKIAESANEKRRKRRFSTAVGSDNAARTIQRIESSVFSEDIRHKDAIQATWDWFQQIWRNSTKQEGNVQELPPVKNFIKLTIFGDLDNNNAISMPKKDKKDNQSRKDEQSSNEAQLVIMKNQIESLEAAEKQGTLKENEREELNNLRQVIREAISETEHMEDLSIPQLLALGAWGKNKLDNGIFEGKYDERNYAEKLCNKLQEKEIKYEMQDKKSTGMEQTSYYVIILNKKVYDTLRSTKNLKLEEEYSSDGSYDFSPSSHRNSMA